MNEDSRLRFSTVTRNKGRSTEAIEFRIQRKRKDKGADHVAYLGRIRKSNLFDKSCLEILRLEVMRRSEAAGFEGDRWLDEVWGAIKDGLSAKRTKKLVKKKGKLKSLFLPIIRQSVKQTIVDDRLFYILTQLAARPVGLK